LAFFLTGLSFSSLRHYEMLKMHHMNLLNEIQETTLMMNLYQQQQLQQQQLRQNAAKFGGHDPTMALLLQGSQAPINPMFNPGIGQSQRLNPGLVNPDAVLNLHMLQQQQLSIMTGGSLGQGGMNTGQQLAMDRLSQLKDDLARQEQLQRSELARNGNLSEKDSLFDFDGPSAQRMQLPQSALSGIGGKRTLDGRPLDEPDAKKGKDTPGFDSNISGDDRYSGADESDVHLNS
jgi:hypothetical protein